LGDDILAGNCTTVTALFSDIYGIKPKWNRLGLEPCMYESLNKAIFNYEFRNREFRLRLYEGSYYVKIDNYEVLSHHKFGIYVVEGALQFFSENHQKVGFELTSKKHNIMVEVVESCQDRLVVAVKNGRGAILTLSEDAYRMVISTCIASDERTIFEFISEAG